MANWKTYTMVHKGNGWYELRKSDNPFSDLTTNNCMTPDKKQEGSTNTLSNDSWDNLKVGSYIGKQNIREMIFWLKVVEITENLIALQELDTIVWYTKQELKDRWTIKDSTPKEEDDTCTCPDGCHGQHNAGNGCKLCDSVTAGGGSGCRSAEEKLLEIMKTIQNYFEDNAFNK